MFDVLVSADALVEDVAPTVRALVSDIGFAEPRRSSWHDFGYGYKAAFLRTQPCPATAPTLVEVIAPAAPESRGGSVRRIDEQLRAYARLQGTRPWKTHGTVVGTSDLDAIIERVRTRGIPHRVEEATPELPFPRLWLGATAADPTAYDPRVDGGVYLELVPPEAYSLYRRPDPDPLGPGALVRVVRRRHLVADVAATLDALRTALDWPEAVVVDDGPLGRTAVIRFSVAASAELELLQPASGSALAGFVERHGPGPHATRIGVNGLDEKTRDLAGRGTPFRRGDGVVEIDPRVVPGLLLELVDVSEVT